MTVRVRLPDLRGDDPSALRGAGWHVLDYERAVVPTLGALRRCDEAQGGPQDACAPRVVQWDLPDGAVVVGLPPSGLTLRARLSPAPEVTPELVVTGTTETRITGVADGGRWRFDGVVAADAGPGPIEVRVDGCDGLLTFDVQLGSTAPAPLPVDPCAIQLAPRLRTVAPHASAGRVSGRPWPRPPLLAVDSAGCVLPAWSVDGHGRTLEPDQERGVRLRVRGVTAWTREFERLVRDAIFIGPRVAVALDERVVLLDSRGCALDTVLGPFEGVLGLGHLEGTVIVIDRGARTLRRFRTDGVELAAPAFVSGRGFAATVRNRALVFDEARCVFRIDPGAVADGCCVAKPRDLTSEEARYFERLADLPALRRRLGYETEGEVLLGPADAAAPLDSGQPGSVWQRVFVQGELPAGTTLALSSRTADDVVSLDPRILDGWSRTVVAGPDDAVEIDTPAKEEAAILDAQVLSDAGRFLGLRLRLRGDGRSTPRIERLFAVREAPSVDRFLPRVFAESTPEDRFLQRWLALFETTVFDGVALRMRRYPELFDPRTAPERMLPYLMGWLAMPLFPATRRDADRMRAILVAAPDLTERRGTPEGLVDLIDAYTGVRVQIRESFVTRSRFVLGGHGSAGPEGVVLGCDTILPAAPPKVFLGEAILGCGELSECDTQSNRGGDGFEVLVPGSQVCSTATLRLIEALVEREKPAHAWARVRPMAPGFVLGAGAILGQETTDEFSRHDPAPASFGIRLGNPARPKPLGQGFALDRGVPLPTSRQTDGRVLPFPVRKAR